MKLFKIIVATPDGATSAHFSGMAAAGAAFSLMVFPFDLSNQKPFIAKWMRQANVGDGHTHVVLTPLVHILIQRTR